jgi:hypothetical protein
MHILRTGLPFAAAVRVLLALAPSAFADANPVDSVQTENCPLGAPMWLIHYDLVAR